MRVSSATVRSAVIRDLAALLDNNHKFILDANAADMAAGQEGGLSPAMLDRLLLNEKRLRDISSSLMEIAAQPDPVGEVMSGGTRPNGLQIVKVRVPLGVIGIIYESRPNVTVDCAALCLRSGNAAILRGGKEAINSNKAFAEFVSRALKNNGLPEDSILLLEDPDRSKMLSLIQAEGFVDMVIPRGGEALIKYVTENARVPVVKHDKGICHIYTDESADFNMSLEIIRNAKVSRPSACNALETLLVNESIAPAFLALLAERLEGVELRGCGRTASIIPVKTVGDEEWGTEYLSLVLSIKIVKDIKEAVAHINRYGSGHSDAILTESYANAGYFLDNVDSACVYVNASTRFTDGGEFGLGAEVGISTQKLHSRGPMGAFDLTTTKYMIYGNGQIR